MKRGRLTGGEVGLYYEKRTINRREGRTIFRKKGRLIGGEVGLYYEKRTINWRGGRTIFRKEDD